jgi:hypothetical protein
MKENDKQLITFIARFFLSAVVILAIWYYVGSYYQNIVVGFSKPILLLMGYTEQHISALRLENVYLYNFNLVSFLALVIATPLKLKRRLKMLFAGIVGLLTVHVIDLIAHFPAYFNNQMAIFVVDMIGVVGLVVPLAIWFIFSFREVSFLRF